MKLCENHNWLAGPIASKLSSPYKFQLAILESIKNIYNLESNSYIGEIALCRTVFEI